MKSTKRARLWATGPMRRSLRADWGMELVTGGQQNGLEQTKMYSSDATRQRAVLMMACDKEGWGKRIREEPDTVVGVEEAVGKWQGPRGIGNKGPRMPHRPHTFFSSVSVSDGDKVNVFVRSLMYCKKCLMPRREARLPEGDASPRQNEDDARRRAAF